MKNKIFFDHTYTMDQNHTFLKTLTEAGFLIEDKTVEHPEVVCKFIMFRNRKYLEFVHDKSEKLEHLKPGISFGHKDKLFNYFEELKKTETLDPKYIHRNYDWKNNNEDLLPGWNYVEFTALGFETFHPWFTEYEERKKVDFGNLTHPNGVEGIFGHKFIINEQGRSFFEKIFNEEINDRLTLSDETVFYFEEGEVNRHAAVLLHSTGDLKFFSCTGSRFENGSLFIKNPHENKNMWDIIIANKNIFTCPKGT